MTHLDANILIDVMRDAGPWSEWCRGQVALAAANGPLALSHVVYAEVSVGFPAHDALDAVLDLLRITLRPPSRQALFLAGRAHLAYRRRGGTRTGVLPDFLVGAQALTDDAILLTRDPRRYRTDFPTLRLIHP